MFFNRLVENRSLSFLKNKKNSPILYKIGKKYFLNICETLLTSESYIDPVIGPNDVPGGENIKTIIFQD